MDAPSPVPAKKSSKKVLIGIVVAGILAVVGGLLHKDLSGLQAPAEKAAEVVVDGVESKLTEKQSQKMAEQPVGVPLPVDAGTP